jgi:predicted acyl esterase
VIDVHGLAVDTGVAMTTRDGVTLRADLYRPAWPDPYPALLLRTPYDRADPTLVSAIVADPVRLAHGSAHPSRLELHRLVDQHPSPGSPQPG